MNRMRWTLAALMAMGLAGSSAWGQEKPREREPREVRGGDGAPERREGDRPRERREGEDANRPQRPEERRGEMGRPGPGDAGRPRPQPGMPGQNQIEVMRNYLGMVDHYTRMAKDPSSSAIAAVVTAGDLLRPRGVDKAIEYFTKLLPEVKDKAVERAVRLQLVELHKMSGQHDQALDQLRALIVAAPAEGEKRASNEVE
jgi:hypothetical protein